MSGLPLATSTWDEAEYSAIEEVTGRGHFSMGEKVKSFEEKFAKKFNSRYCVMVNSGSSANLLAVAALFYRKENPLKRGDEVIVPAVSWSTTYFPLQQYGLHVKFVDIDEKTMNMDLEKLLEAISEKTKLIFSVNLLGNSLNYPQIMKILEERNITLIEDNCESMGASLNGKYAGTWGALGTFSSFFSHHISTMEGGMILTDDEELFHIVLCLRAHGWTRNLPKSNKIAELSDDKFMESFRFILPGYNVRPLEMSGAIGIHQLEKLDSIVEGRRKNAAFFKRRFEKLRSVSIQDEVGESSWFGFALVFSNGELRNKAIQLFEKNSIDCRPVVAGNFTLNSAIRFFDYSIHGELNSTNKIHNCGLFIGNHHYDVTNELNKVAEMLESIT